MRHHAVRRHAHRARRHLPRPDLLVRAWLDAMPEVADAALAPDAPTPARYIVIYVQNVTDVDDPLLERAARDGEDWRGAGPPRD